MKLINKVSNKNSTACRALSHLYKQDSHYMSVLKFKDFQGLSRTLKLHFQGQILDKSLQHGQYYSNI